MDSYFKALNSGDPAPIESVASLLGFPVTNGKCRAFEKVRARFNKYLVSQFTFLVSKTPLTHLEAAEYLRCYHGIPDAYWNTHILPKI